MCDWTNVGTEIDLKNQISFWCSVYDFRNAVGVYCFRSLAKLVLTKLCLPISNAFVERVFSQVALVKNKIRNKIGNKLLKSILMVRSHLMLNNVCCKDFLVPDEMLTNFNSSMYGNESQHEWDSNEAEEAFQILGEIF